MKRRLDTQTQTGTRTRTKQHTSRVSVHSAHVQPQDGQSASMKWLTDNCFIFKRFKSFFIYFKTFFIECSNGLTQITIYTFIVQIDGTTLVILQNPETTRQPNIHTKHPIRSAGYEQHAEHPMPSVVPSTLRRLDEAQTV